MTIRNINRGSYVHGYSRDESYSTILKAKFNSSKKGNTGSADCVLSTGSSSEWKCLNLLRDKFSFLRRGIVAKAANSLLGVTRIESVLKLFELRLISSSDLRNEKSEGSVQKSLEATSRILREGKYWSS